MSNLNKETNKELAKAIQELYINTRAVNAIAGNTLSKERVCTQKQAVEAEFKELKEAITNKDLGESCKESADLLVTLSEMVMILDEDVWLLENMPLYLNKQQDLVEDLLINIEDCLKSFNYIDALGYTEDLVSQLNADMVHNLSAVCESNLSKFPLLSMLEELDLSTESICDSLNGRYENVYAETTQLGSDTYVVFKSKYDILNDEHYPTGKFLKPKPFYKEPTMVIYE